MRKCSDWRMEVGWCPVSEKLVLEVLDELVDKAKHRLEN